MLVAAGIGIYLALSTISDAFKDDDAVSAPGRGDASETPSASDGASPTEEPAPDDALVGDPLSFTRLEAAWEGKGITATPGEVSDSVRGFGVTAVSVTLERSGSEMEVAVLLYDGPQGPSADWNLGDPPSPKGGRTIPEGAFVWYNLNAVIVIVESNDVLRNDARDAFFGLNA